MGKVSKNNNKQRRQQKKNEKKKLKNYKPFVSVCTPTFNRRPFFDSIIKCYQHQDYPHDKMEWIIIDDGTDTIEDKVKDIPGVKYFKYDDKMTLGKKRNLLNEKSKGEIIVHMDDDIYYPPTRVSHAVTTLMNNKTALCAGSSEVYIWFNHIKKMYQFGPYSPKHATADSFAFKRELLEQTRYNEESSLAEEKEFLKNYTIPFVQLNPRYTELVFSHEQNTVDKQKLLVNANKKFVKESDKTVDYFISDPELRDFYVNKIYDIIKDYEPGNIENKPDVIKQTKEMNDKRAEKQNESIKISLKMPDGMMKEMNMNELNKHVNEIQNKNKQYISFIEQLKDKVKLLHEHCMKLENINKELTNKVNGLTVEEVEEVKEVNEVEQIG